VDHVRFEDRAMRSYTAVDERCFGTNLSVGYVPGFAGAYGQGATLDDLHANMEK
jgi:predicted RNase H-like HicB family nuclease